MKTNIQKGIILALIAAGISGLSIFYNKLVIVKGIDSLIFNILKNGGVAIILTIILLTRNKVSTMIRLRKSQWVKLIAIALIGGSIPFILYFEGLKSVPAINANIIQKTMFIWVAMMALPLLGERLTKIQLVGYALIAWSNLFIGGFSGFTWSKPELMIIGATLLWSIEQMIAKVALQSIESIIVAWARMFLGTIILLTIAMWQGKIGLLATVTPEQMVGIIGSITFLTMYVLIWYQALSFAPVTLVTSLLILATPITNILSALFLTHTLPIPQITNLVGTSIGILFLTRFLYGRRWT